MRPIDRSEILPIGDYEQIRARFRARVIEEKRPRRVKLGEQMSAVFENRDSVLLQIQEMLRTERIMNESGIAHEIGTYNELIPAPGELSLTMFVEIPDAVIRDRMLIELKGLEGCVSVEVDGVRAAAKSDPKGVMPDRTTAVHYFKIKLSEAAIAAIRSKTAKVAVRVDHPRYIARTELGPVSITKLAEDLA
ncbi:DUF3501 family protein [Polyangium mundeleinium]|uniref:DUF3501 family protein n=1 Tax=Polyangium mundeleinium TaxID=2995306 RepID=A0ABT5F060_9BACT|nr:DUF3501 family protein [Polyangium mundeleinium]MDC0746823.1 DUF3501 family protein [Polyangium mundeleinium]